MTVFSRASFAGVILFSLHHGLQAQEGKAVVPATVDAPEMKPEGAGPHPDGGRPEGPRRDGPGDWRGPGKGPPGREGGEFENLSEEDKKRVREALEKVWSRPEVKQAREQLMKANDDMRSVIRAALMEIDPEMEPLLEKMVPGGRSWDGRPGGSRLPDVESPEFPNMMVHRLEGELLTFTPVDRRTQARALHERIMTKPAVKAALEKLKSVPIPERVRATEALRNAYRLAAAAEMKAAKENAGEANAEGNKE